MDVVPFIESPFKTMVAWERYASLSPEGRLVDATVMSDRLGVAVASASLRQDQFKMGGLSGEIRFIDVVLASGETLKIVFKAAKGSPQRAALGNAREYRFYNAFGSVLAAHANVPKCYWARGDMATGEVAMLLEELEHAVPSGVVFGPAQPNNWGIRDELDTLCAEAIPLGPAGITRDAFQLYARMHATYWQDSGLTAIPWLRGSTWYAGEGEGEWVRAQAQAQEAWVSIRAAVDEGTSPVRWDAHTLECMDTSFGKVDWGAFQEARRDRRRRPFTLVHGDAHPHNFMWVSQGAVSADRGRQYLIDFEMVGIGSGPQELGQYVISHCEPTLRRANAREWVQSYHEELLTQLRARGRHAEAEDYSFDACFDEYVAGGAGRWVWFVPVLMSMGLPPEMIQFFHDQLAAFLHDHVADPSQSPMPRV